MKLILSLPTHLKLKLFKITHFQTVFWVIKGALIGLIAATYLILYIIFQYDRIVTFVGSLRKNVEWVLSARPLLTHMH